MALDLGDIRFGFTADLSGIKQAHTRLRNWARDIQSIVARTDDLSVSLQHAATGQERSIRKATEQVKSLNAEMSRIGAPATLLNANNRALITLRRNMQAGQHNALDFARANDKFAVSLNTSKRRLIEFKNAQKNLHHTETSTINATARLRRQIEQLQMASGGITAQQIKQERAQKVLNDAVKMGIISQEKATTVQRHFTEASIVGSKSVGASASRLRRQLESIQIASGGAAAAEIRLTRAQYILREAISAGIVTQEKAVVIEDAFATSINRSRTQLIGFTKALMVMRQQVAGLRKVAFTLNSLVAAVFFVTLGLRATIGEAAIFQEAMVKVRNLTGQSAEQIKLWGAAILKMAPALGQSPVKLAEAFQFIGGAGIKASKVIQTVGDVAKATSIGLGEVADVGKLVTSVMGVYPKTMGNAAKVLGVLIAAISRGEAAGPDYAASMGQVLSMGRTLGVSFYQLAASVAVFTDQGLTAQRASILLANLLRAILNPSKEAGKALSNLYVHGQQLSPEFLRMILRTKGLEKVLRLLSQAAHSNATDLAKVLGSSRAVRAAFGLLIDNGRQMASVFKTVGAAGAKTFQKAWGLESQTAMQRFRQAFAAMEVASIKISNSILPAVAKLTGSIAKHIQIIIHWIKVLGSVLISYFIARVLISLNTIGWATIGTIREFGRAFVASTTEATIAARGLKIAVIGLRGAMALLGGPIGIIAIAAGLIWQFSAAQNRARQRSIDFAGSIDLVTLSTQKMNRADKEALRLKIASAKITISKNLRQAEAGYTGLTYWQKLRVSMSEGFNKYVANPWDTFYNYGKFTLPIKLPKGSPKPVSLLIPPAPVPNLLTMRGTSAQYSARIIAIDKWKDALTKLNAAQQLVNRNMTPKKGLVSGKKALLGPSAETINEAIVNMQKYTNKIKVHANAVLQSNAAKAKAKAILEAENIVRKIANGNIAQMTALMKILTPYINKATSAWKKYFDSMDQKKEQARIKSVQSLIAKLNVLGAATNRAKYINSEYTRALIRLGGVGSKMLEIATKYKKILEQVRIAAAKAFDARQMQLFARQAASNIQNAFAQFFFDPFKEGLRGLVIAFITAIQRMVANMAALRTMKELQPWISGLIQGIGSAAGKGTTSATGHAYGGIIHHPTYFGMSNGQTGVMGESGPEAIMPLTRTAGGVLGIRATGGQRTLVVDAPTYINAQGAGPDEVAKILSFGALLEERMKHNVEYYNTYGAWPA